MLLFYPLPVFAMRFFAGRPPSDAFLSQVISVLTLLMIILQFPVYGFIISYTNLKRSLWLKLCGVVVWLHMIAIMVCLAIFSIHSL